MFVISNIIKEKIKNCINILQEWRLESKCNAISDKINISKEQNLIKQTYSPLIDNHFNFNKFHKGGDYIYIKFGVDGNPLLVC